MCLYLFRKKGCNFVICLHGEKIASSQPFAGVQLVAFI